MIILYEEAERILLDKFDHSNLFLHTQTSKNLPSFLGRTRAKNSIYNRKFGFQSRSSMFVSDIVKSDIKPNKGLLDLCDGCEDCINNCPVGAIHEDWIDAKACDNHIGQGIKWFWYEKMKPDIPFEEVESWSSWETMPVLEWGQGVDGFYKMDGYQLKRDGEPISITHCRECVLQPRCSKAPCLSQ